MGVIQRQGFKHSLVNLVGVGIGLMSTLFIYPRALELYGLAQIILASSVLLMSFFTLGLNVVAVRYFPTFKDPSSGHRNFLSFLLVGGFVGFVLFLFLFPLVKILLVDYLFANNSRVELFEENIIYIIPLVFLMIFNFLLLKYVSNFHRVVVPTILDQILIKLSLPVLVILFLMDMINYQLFFIGLIINYVVVLLGLIFYTKALGQLHLGKDFGFIDRPLFKEMRKFSFYGLLNALGSQLAFRIDTIMVGAMVGIASGGVYSIVNVIIDVITKPAKAIHAIATPIISENWSKNNTKDIDVIYKKSSIVLLLFGFYVFFGIWLSIDDLFHLMPNTEQLMKGKYVVLFLGLGKLVDLATSVNSPIIGMSPKFKFNFYALMTLAVLNVFFNILFIKVFELGMVGAALATLLSLTLFNIGKAIFIYIQFKLNPFTRKTFFLLLIALTCFYVSYILPFDFHALTNILIRSILFSILYLGACYVSQISDDFNENVNKVLGRMRT